MFKVEYINYNMQRDTNLGIRDKRMGNGTLNMLFTICDGNTM